MKSKILRNLTQNNDENLDNFPDEFQDPVVVEENKQPQHERSPPLDHHLLGYDNEMNLEDSPQEDHKFDMSDHLNADEDGLQPDMEESPQEDAVMKSEFPKEKIDVLNDPLLPDDMEIGRSSGKKKARGGSFSDDGRAGHIQNEGLNLDDLDQEERLLVIQDLYAKYNEDPENFPEEQRILLEEELQDLIDKGIIDGFEEGEESEVDPRMEAHGEVNFPSNPLPFKDEEEVVENIETQENLDVQEVDMKKDNIDFYNKSEQEEHEDEESLGKETANTFLNFIGPIEETKGDPNEEDEEAEEIEENYSKNEGENNEEPEPEIEAEDNNEEQAEVINQAVDEYKEIDDETKLAYLQKMHAEQQKISQRVSRRKKSKKKKKKRRPVTAKYSYGMMRDRYPRPWTAHAVKPKKKKRKGRKTRPQDVYLEQLRQQQLLQQLAMEQENAQRQEEEEMKQQNPDENIEISPEQAVLLYQQLMERQQSGEKLTEEELEQLQFLHNLLEQNMRQQQQIEEQEKIVSGPVKKVRRKKSKNRGKRKGRKNIPQMDQNQLYMLQQMQMQNQQQNENIGVMEEVDEIKEEDEEDTPIRELNEGKTEEQPEEEPGVVETDIPTQINAQVPAQFRMDEEEEESKLNETPIYQQNPNQMFQKLTPEQLFQMQQMQQMQNYQQNNQTSESAEREEKYKEDPNEDLAVLNHILKTGAQNGYVKKDLLSILPLSQSVAKAKKKFKPMEKYELDVYDKKLQGELKKAQNTANSEHYFQEILKQSLENALIGQGLSSKQN